MICFYSLGLLKTIIAGGIGGTSLWATVYPADVIKSRAQVSNFLPNRFLKKSISCELNLKLSAQYLVDRQPRPDKVTKQKILRFVKCIAKSVNLN